MLLIGPLVDLFRGSDFTDFLAPKLILIAVLHDVLVKESMVPEQLCYVGKIVPALWTYEGTLLRERCHELSFVMV